MTDAYILKAFMEQGEKMRDLQKKYFTCKDPVEKKSLLSESKNAEKQFDNLLFNARQLKK